MNTDISDFNLNAGSIKELDVFGNKFLYKLPTNEDQLGWAPEYMETKINGEERITKINPGKLSFCKLRNIIEIPYAKEIVKQVVNEDKEFIQLTESKRIEFLSKLNGNIVSEIIKQISLAETSEDDLKKN